jgi:hypothetical protein
MRYPKHIILDVSKPNLTNTNDYWVNKYRSSFARDEYFNTSLNVMKPFSPSSKSITSLKTSTTSFKTSYFNQSTKLLGDTAAKESSLLWTLFDINFLKREKLYTKLKYSRSPAYDIVSGGVAALFAGFIGSLISEKFGIELVDSGDFYTFFMYVVFLCFSLRPLIKILSKESTLWNFASPKFLLNYFYVAVTLLFRLVSDVTTIVNKKFRGFKLSVFTTVGSVQNSPIVSQLLSTSTAKFFLSSPYFNSFSNFLSGYLSVLNTQESDDELRPFLTFFKNVILFSCWTLFI